MDYNPVAAFWVDDNLLQFKKDKCKVIHSTYKDNVYLSPEQVYEIESHRSDKNWWRVYGLGEIGFSEGAIYSNWDEVEASAVSRVFSETADAFAKGFRYIINKGGARSGKTFSILQFFLFLCMYRSLKITVTSRDLIS